jgi:hypothetical protein
MYIGDTDFLGMDLLDPDFGNSTASDLLNSLEGIAEPFGLSLLVVHTKSNLPAWLGWLVAFRPMIRMERVLPVNAVRINAMICFLSSSLPRLSRVAVRVTVVSIEW